MMQAVAEQIPDLVNLRFTSWDGNRGATLNDVMRDATIGEVLDEARRVMDLPIDSAYQALLDGRELNNMDTLADVGIESEAELEIAPDVQAG
jgi:hypothetical protein